MRAAAAPGVLLLLVLLPAAAAQTPPGHGEQVSVLGAEFPPAALADRPFYVNVTVQNKAGTEQRITLFATLYEGQGTTPCEGSRAIQTLSKFQKSATLAPGQTLRVEGEAEHWAQEVNGSRVPADGAYEVCVWARMAQCPQGADLATCFLDYHRLQLPIRKANAPPRPTATAEPARAAAGAPFTFRAEAADPDGDAVSFAWDFGDGLGGTGALASHAYARAGNYTVTVNATDGFDSAEAALRVEVVPGPAGGGGVPGFEAAPLALAAALTAAAARAAGRR